MESFGYLFQDAFLDCFDAIPLSSVPRQAIFWWDKHNLVYDLILYYDVSSGNQTFSLQIIPLTDDYSINHPFNGWLFHILPCFLLPIYRGLSHGYLWLPGWLVLTKTKDVEVEEFRHGVFSCFEDCTPWLSENGGSSHENSPTYRPLIGTVDDNWI